MEIGIVGLGRMGGNIAQRLLRAGHQVIAFDTSTDAVQALKAKGATGVRSLDAVVDKLSPPRTVWLMLPAGQATESTIASLIPLLSKNDTVLDGGNSYYMDSMRRHAMLKEHGVNFLDVGTSGGIWGLKEGYSLMIGGERKVFKKLEPLFQALAPAPNKGYGYMGNAGAGHFVKMVHNGIEYGLMQAYAEGFELLKAKKEFGLDLSRIAEVWRYGSVVRSWLLDLTASALEENPALEGIQGYVEDSGEGRWTAKEAVDLGVPAPVITLALQERFRSRQDNPYSAKLLAAMRHKFGGHAIKKTS